MVQRLTYRRRLSYNTASNKTRLSRTPGNVGDTGAQLERQREHELTQGDVWEHVLDEIGRGGRHAATSARGAEAAALAAEANDFLLATVGAREHGEATPEDATVDETLELVLHEGGQRRCEAVLRGGVQREQVVPLLLTISHIF